MVFIILLARAEARWFEFATAIIGLAGNVVETTGDLADPDTSEYPTPAIRSADTRIGLQSGLQKFVITLRPWQQSLADTIDRLLTNKVVNEGNNSCGRLGNAALPSDACHQQAIAAGLRQADGVLSAVGADAGGNSRDPADLNT